MFSIFMKPRTMLLFGASTLVACTGEKVLENTNNSPPSITIMSHTDGFEVLRGIPNFSLRFPMMILSMPV